MSRIVLAIVAHADDAEFAAGGLLASLVRDGARGGVKYGEAFRRVGFPPSIESIISGTTA